ncbi:MAG: LamG domain-containing protein [Myxococcota bacterium]
MVDPRGAKPSPVDRWVWGTLAAWLLVCGGHVGCMGCGGDAAASVFVEVETDLTPGGEFDAVTTSAVRISDGEVMAERRVDVAASSDYRRARRVAEFAGLPAGNYRVISEARLGDTGVDTGSAVIEGQSNVGVTIRLTRSCRGIACGSAETCIGGACRPELCAQDWTSACGEFECGSTECAAPSECAPARCLEGVCFARADDSLCGGGRCSVDDGCGGMVDGGADADAGMDAGDATLDAEVDASDADASTGPAPLVYLAMESVTIDGRVIDQSGNDLDAHCEPGACPTVQAGRIGQGLRFADGRYLTIADDPRFAFTEYTFAAWIRLRSIPTFNGLQTVIVIPHGDEFSSTAYLGTVEFGMPGLDVFFAMEGSGPSNVTEVAPFGVDTWVHLAAVWDGSRMRLYVDGADLGSAPRDVFDDRGRDLHIGADFHETFDQFNWFPGTIDEVRIYDQALPRVEILLLANP